MSEKDIEILERALRESFARHAEEAVVDQALVKRAAAAAKVGRRRRSGWVLAASVAAAVGVVAVAQVVQLGGSPAQVDPSRPNVASTPPAPLGPSGEMRTEFFGDVAVDVPVEWGYGAAPIGEVGDAVTCFPGAAVEADGARHTDESAIPYVGRPVVLTDMCVPYPDNRPDQPSVDYVWLGAAVAPGTVELPHGRTQVTVEVDGVTVTVATSDTRLQERILDSVRGGERCMSELPIDGPIIHDAAAPGADPIAMNVCVYDFDRRTANLAYATRLGAVAVQRYVAAVADGAPPADQCPAVDYMLGQAVLIELVDAEDRVVRQDAVNTVGFCAGIGVDADRLWVLKTTKLTPAMVAPWVVEGIPAVVTGDPELGLIGPQG